MHIEGEETLRRVLGAVNDWCGVLVQLAERGSKSGIHLTRPANGGPTDRALVEQLRPFPFADDTERRRLVHNIVRM